MWHWDLCFRINKGTSDFSASSICFISTWFILNNEDRIEIGLDRLWISPSHSRVHSERDHQIIIEHWFWQKSKRTSPTEKVSIMSFLYMIRLFTWIRIHLGNVYYLWGSTDQSKRIQFLIEIRTNWLKVLIILVRCELENCSSNERLSDWRLNLKFFLFLVRRIQSLSNLKFVKDVA